MKKLLIILALIVPFSLWSQQPDNTETNYGPFKIVFQLASSDTLVHKSLMRQLSNIKTVSPETQLEVVCHGPGIEILKSGSTTVRKKLEEHAQAGVVFDACEFTMKEKKIAREELLPVAQTVRAGILHIVQRQSEGWYYIKSGF
ncbi:MAG: hypothetical protein RL220_323 [Bacteroidota bacterium]|jgi:intracellular sulfur oxidation DsrE/DsrF family protein